MSSDCEMCSDWETYDPRDLYGDDSDSDSEINDEEYTLTVTFKVSNKTMNDVHTRILQLRDELFNDGQLKEKQLTFTIKKV